MTYYEFAIYIDGLDKPLCTLAFESKQALDKFVSSLTSNSELIMINGYVFRRKDFKYGKTTEKVIKSK